MLIGEIVVAVISVVFSVGIFLLRYFLYDRIGHPSFIETIQFIGIFIDTGITIFNVYILLHFLLYGSMF